MRIPRDALLDKFASVAPDGSYSSSIPSLSTRFGVVVGGLTTGELASHKSLASPLTQDGQFVMSCHRHGCKAVLQWQYPAAGVQAGC